MAIVIIAFPLMAPAFPIINWLTGRNIEASPATAAEVHQFPKLVPRGHHDYEVPRNHTNSTHEYEFPRNHTNSTHGDGHGYYPKTPKTPKTHHGLTPLPRSVDVPGPKIRDAEPQNVAVDPAAAKKRDNVQID